MSTSHAETLARVQAEKTAAEEKRKQSEKQMKLDLERIQTDYALRVSCNEPSKQPFH
jgi:hypothetical protein